MMPYSCKLTTEFNHNYMITITSNSNQIQIFTNIPVNLYVMYIL